MYSLILANTMLFLSTLSLRRATFEKFEGVIAIKISIHALLAESDSQSLLLKVGIFYFYPRSPCGERQLVSMLNSPHGKISIHALLAESDPLASGTKTIFTISIHALLAESDHYDNYNLHCTEISIHALLAESDQTVQD